MAQNTNPNAISKAELTEKLTPVISHAPIRIHNTVKHSDAFSGGAPVHIPPEDN